MGIESVTATLRPRNPWEAMDLGLALYRRHLGPIYRAWLLVLVPVTGLALAITGLEPAWTALVVWWLKPLLDRVPLYLLARRLFDEPVRARQAVTALAGQWRAIGADLTLRRLSPARSFHLPVSQLEGLGGRARRRRLAVLAHPRSNPPLWLTTVCLHLEGGAYLALLGLIWLFLPQTLWSDYGLLLVSETPAADWLSLGVYLLALSLIEPFYVAAGFTLYLNRRTWLEAWDLEVGLRRLAQRLAGPALVIMVMIYGWPSPTLAQEMDEPCRQRQERQEELAAGGPVERALARVLTEPELALCETRTVWRLKNPPEPDDDAPDPPPAWVGLLATTLEWLLWAGLAVALAWLVWHLARRWQGLPTRYWPRVPPPPPTRRQGPEAVEPLPPDLADRALALGREGNLREALALLYRGSLTALAPRLGPARGTTEDEVLALAARRLTGDDLAYLSRLTRTWQAMAYAHRPPALSVLEELCRGWQHHFAGETS